MAHATHTVTVAQPIDQVFAFLADGTNNPKWRPGVTTIKHVSGDGVGALWAQQMKGPGGRTIDGDYKVTAYDAPNRLDFQVVAGPARPTGSFTLKAVDDATTEVTFTLDLKPRGLMVLMTPMINKQVRTEAEALGRLPDALAAG
jgi:uncharacterized protein YndB with AHSA1/START domain